MRIIRYIGGVEVRVGMSTAVVEKADVVELYSESLGPPRSPAGTFLDMVRTNATRIAAALAG